MADHTTLVYRYGLLRPTRGEKQIDEQMRKAHDYQNTLVEIERDRRARWRELVHAHPDVAPLVEQVESLAEDVEVLRNAAMEDRAERRSRDTDEELGSRLAQARRGLRQTKDEMRKARRRAIRADDELEQAVRELDRDAVARRKRERKASGLYWGTYLLVEQAVDQAAREITPPRFRRWTGQGAVAAQIQKGITVDELTDCGDRRLQLDLDPRPVPGRTGSDRPRVRVRVGSDGRDPIWGEWPVVYHRALPTEARIMWAKVLRRRRASDTEWSLHLTVRLPEGWTKEECGDGTVTVDLRWRRDEDALRACEWIDDEGRRETVHLESEVTGALQKAADLRSIRDQHLNDLRPWIVGMRESLPDDEQERCETIAQWRSAPRFAALSLRLRDLVEEETGVRFDRRHDDESWDGHPLEEIVAQLEEWRKRDKHLWQWESNARRKARARRKHQYRNLAAEMSRRYGRLVLERLDLRRLARRPEPDSDRDDVPQGRSQRVKVAPAELREALVNAFQLRGGEVVTVKADGPVEILMAMWRERSGVAEMAASARTARGSRFDRRKASGEVEAG